MTSPRVLLVVKGLDIGGIERVVMDLALGLARRGEPIEVAVVNDRRDALLGPVEAAVPVHRLEGTDRVGVPAARALLRLISEERFDVAHVHAPLVAVIARLGRHRPPIVTTSHTLWRGLRPPVRIGWRLTAQRDAAMVAVSSNVAASLPRQLASRVRVIPHGVDLAAAARAREAAASARSSARSSVVTAVTVASHRDVKNYPNLLHAVRVARESGAQLRLVAVGEGDDLPRHRELADALGLHDVVSFEPPTPDVLGVIAASDLLVVASDFEGQPLVVAEALALGRPVVATAVGRVPELVTPDVGRVVPPGDQFALGHALAELSGDPELRQTMSDAAERAARAWTLDAAIDAHVALYREVAAVRTGRR